MDEKIDKLDNHMEAIKHLLITLNDKIESLEEKVDNLNKKIDGEVLEECKKMGSHIDFVENVYDNVKHPLGYICKKIKYITGNDKTQYTLIDLSMNDIV